MHVTGGIASKLSSFYGWEFFI